MKSLPDPEDNLLTAGIDAIKVGIEDIEHPDRARKVAAIRNFYAGVLLLCKHRLVHHAPPKNPLILIAAKTRYRKSDTGEIEQVPDGVQTVGAVELFRRLEDIETDLDIARLKDLQKHRNEIEHYFTSAKNEKLHEVFVEVQLLVNDLLARCGKSNVLGPIWVKLVEGSDAFVARRERSHADLAHVAWKSPDVRDAISDLRYIELCECGSSHIIRADASIRIQDKVALKCLACNAALSTESFIEAVLEWRYGGEDWEAAKSDELYAVYECPQCQRQTYLREKDQCASCGYVAEDETCEHCGKPLGIIHITNGDAYHDECAYRADVMAKD